KWQRCVAASIAVGPSAILTGSRTRPSDWGWNGRFGPVEDRRNNHRLVTVTCIIWILQIWWLSPSTFSFALSVAPVFLLAIWERGDLGNCTIRQAALVGLVGHLERFDTMRIGFFCLVAMGGFFGTGLWVAAGPQAKDAPVSEGSSRDVDREDVLQSSRDFTAAFEKGDAKAVAALWTEQGEYESDEGTILRGRTAIEAAFAARFKDRPAGKMEIKVENIRFPSRDTAVEEGMTRTTASDMLPDSTYYRTVHVREDGKWRMALSREWGAAENRIADLDWLIGSWRGQAKDHEMSITFEREKDRPFIA